MKAQKIDSGNSVLPLVTQMKLGLAVPVCTHHGCGEYVALHLLNLGSTRCHKHWAPSRGRMIRFKTADGGLNEGKVIAPDGCGFVKVETAAGIRQVPTRGIVWMQSEQIDH